MNMDIMDAINEVEIALKKEAAVLESFMNEFTIKPKRDALLSIETHFEQFQYMAHVVADVLHDAQEKAESLGEMAGKEWEANRN